MARQLRLDAAGLTHHVTARGNNRKTIFRDDVDCEKFLKLLGEAVRRYNLVLLSYVLMVNHFHLVLETPEATLSRGMQWLDGAYATWFNNRTFAGKRRKRVGHVFQGRFHSFVVDSETYLLEVLRYVALNPVRSKSIGAERPEDYRWSSYRATAGFEAPPPWLAVSPVLSRLREDVPEAQQLYRSFVCEKIGDHTSIWKNVVNGIFLGSEPWLLEMRTLVEAKMRTDEHPRKQTAVGRPSCDKIVDAVAEVFDITEADVRDGHGGAPRMIMAWLSRYEGLAMLREIAAVLRLKSSGYVSDLISYCDRELTEDARLRHFVDRCLDLLRPAPSPGSEETLPWWPALPLSDSIAESTPVYLA